MPAVYCLRTLIAFGILFFSLSGSVVKAQFSSDKIFNTSQASSATSAKPAPNTPVKVRLSTQQNKLYQWFACFDTIAANARYSITLCADVPDNGHPNRPLAKGEPGHVFIILSKRELTDSCAVHIVYGFYPIRPVSTVVFRQVKSKILAANSREYDASVSKDLTREEFEWLLQQSVTLAAKKYNLNKYNCYDYALELFNSLPDIEPLPVSRTKFPFIGGKGGSPCSLYRDLKKLKDDGSAWAPYIRFGAFRSPMNCNH